MLEKYFGLCAMVGFIGAYKGWTFLPTFVFSIFLTPVVVGIFLIFLGQGPYYSNWIHDDPYEDTYDKPNKK